MSQSGRDERADSDFASGTSDALTKVESPREGLVRMPPSRCRSSLREIPDETLMQRYVDGDTDAFDELFRRYESRAFAYFIRRTGSRECARDLYQELFLRIHRARDDYDPARAFAPWFFQIARRLLVDDRRRAYRSHEFPLGDSDTCADHTSDRDDVADREQLDRMLAALSSQERFALVSAKLEGVGYAELASQLGKSVDAVKKMVSRALQRLRAAPLASRSSR